MKKKIITLSSLDDVPEGAEFVGERTELIGYNFLVPAEDTQPEPSPEPSPTPESSPEPIRSFVTVNGNEFFEKDGHPVYFAGTNAYYLPTYENHDQGFCSATWDLFSKANINLVRTWAFYDGPPKFSGDPYFQRFENASPVYNDEGLRCLDRTVAKAAERGIYLILSLTNYHPELGGYREYCKGAGVPETFFIFMNDTVTRKWFREYVSMILNRVNTITGRKYKDEPAILAWELCNEARNRGHEPESLRDWYQSMATYVKSIDPNHLVCTGEDGFEDASTGTWGTDGKIRNNEYSVDKYSNTYVLRAGEGTSYLLNTSIPEIDFGSYHWYPSDFGFGYLANANLLEAGNAWIEDHSLIAAAAGKPSILGEYGFHIDWMPSELAYSTLWRACETYTDGALLWQFVLEGPKLNEFGGNIAPTRGPYSSFLAHVENMKLPKSVI